MASTLQIKLLPVLYTCSLHGPACGKGQCLLFRGQRNCCKEQRLSPICTMEVPCGRNQELRGQALPGLAVVENHCSILLSLNFYLEIISEATESCKNKNCMKTLSFIQMCLLTSALFDQSFLSSDVRVHSPQTPWPVPQVLEQVFPQNSL